MNWAIGDIHGCVHTLRGLIDNVLLIDKDARFIFVGDYVDRGKFSKQVIDYIIELCDQNRVESVLCGNHDLVWSYLCGAERPGQSEYTNYNEIVNWWIHNGLISCLDSYGIPFDRNHPFGLKSTLRYEIPQSHKDFLLSLQYFWENDDYFISHALKPASFINGNREINESTISIMVWDRPNYEYMNTNHEKICIHGHTPTNDGWPEKGVRCILIDTHYRNRITAYCLDTKEFIFQETDNKDIT